MIFTSQGHYYNYKHFADNKIMQKWEEKQRQRAHHYMIEQAKPTIKRYSKSREKPNLSSSRTNSNSINLPFRQVLTMLQLEKYEPLLISYGFPQRIKEKQSMICIDEIIQGVEAEDQEKFYSLMSILLSITLDPKSSIKKTPILKKAKNKNLPPTSTSSNLKKCDSLFNKNCDSYSNKKYQKTQNFRIKSKTHIQRQSFHSPPLRPFLQKTVQKRSKARDDISIIHQINLKGFRTVKFISKTNSLLGRIEERLKKIKGYEERNDEVYRQAKLYYNEIKEMYLSYDSATLTSNIANIDIEEIIECYAIEIESHLTAQFLNPEKNEKKLKSSKYHIEKLLKKSLIQNKIESQVTENSCLDDDVNQTISIGSSSEEKSEVEESSEMFDLEKQSVAYDLSCFDNQYQDELQGTCGRKDIKNFIQLVMMAGKMQKQTPILSYAYILRLLSVCKKDQINWKNWKNLTLITLIEASKIWDDQSLENHSFSKVIQPYTTLQINRLERHLLTFLNYRLQVEPKEYCESYFRLRKNAQQACKTAHLMHLSLKTIKKLQSGTKKCEKDLKQTYKKKLNQSF